MMLKPTLLPLGDAALLVRFSDTLSDEANLRAIALARLDAERPEGVQEVAPGLVSILLRTHPGYDFQRLCGEIRLRIDEAELSAAPGRPNILETHYDGADLAEVASLLGMSVSGFVERHAAATLRVLATGFAPGFVYCGFHAGDLIVHRRETVRPMVPAGTILFAAGQTAVAATPIRSGWHIIGTTPFQNFTPDLVPPTKLRPGDLLQFAASL